MLFRPRLVDYKIIGFYTGKLTTGIGLLMLLPMVISLCCREWSPALDFAFGASVSAILGFALIFSCRTNREMSWIHGIVVVPIAWLVAMVLGAVPLYLSGHFASFLDAMFDSMSGFATTGLALVQDLDHLSYGHNFWRHLTMFIGGQGIVVITITLMTGGAAGLYGMYVGEGREEKILPNLKHTARIIWLVSLVYLVFGSLMLWLVGWEIGMHPARALFHGVTNFMAAFDTGGFTPQSQSVLYYHSAAYELALVPLMVAGGINFSLHYALFSGRRRELLKNTEARTLAATIGLTFMITAAGLTDISGYSHAMAVFRRGFFQIVSAHTGTGFQTVYGPQFADMWGPLAVVGIAFAMGLGASVGSTAGGIKALRINIVTKAFLLEAKRLVLPQSAVLFAKYHHLKKNVISERIVLNAFLIGSAYLLTYIVGGVAGTFFDYPFMESFFESISAAANVGLTTGITMPDMPDALKVVYVVQMWVGRLEFLSVMALVGFMVSAVRGR
ncbi:MAG: TrkH family potassium uptake protein [Actinomycetota bacterium]|nr:TrkH family potassium uptake protein [Actinomycetota bacterium]